MACNIICCTPFAYVYVPVTDGQRECFMMSVEVLPYVSGSVS